MSDDADDDDHDLALPEPDPAPSVRPGLASWAERRHGGPPPYEESDEQADARRRVRGEADADFYERRRKRIARIAVRREAAEKRATERRLADRWRVAP